MDRLLVQDSLRRHVRFSFSRSAGPGGQNVNKVNTKVDAWFDLARLEGLTAAETEHLRQSLPERFLQDGVIHLAVSDERSQLVNRERALLRLELLIATHAPPPKHRRPTKPTRASKERRLESKHQAASRKRDRTPPSGD